MLINKPMNIQIPKNPTKVIKRKNTDKIMRVRDECISEKIKQQQKIYNFFMIMVTVAVINHNYMLKGTFLIT